MVREYRDGDYIVSQGFESHFVENTIGVSPEQTIAYQQKAIAYFSESIFPTKDFVATLLESLIERSQSKLDRALEKNLEVVEALENHQPSSHFSKMLLSKMLGYLGNIYIRSHYYEPGLDYLFTAISVRKKEHVLLFELPEILVSYRCPSVSCAPAW